MEKSQIHSPCLQGTTMNRFFYQRIAMTNLRKNSNIYIPFVLTAIGTIIMFYNACALAFNEATGTGQAAVLMLLGTIVTGIFSTVFLFYTNSFLVKRRKKEWGLYHVLGMEKKHIAKISMWETIFIALFSLVTGIILGIIFSKLFTLILYNILALPPKYGFEIAPFNIAITVLCFLGIFTLILLNSVVVVYRSNPIELLKGSNVGEKEPKTNWIVALIGLIALTTGYIMALTTDNPMDAIPNFFMAVLLVIIGTYCLFSAGSIALLKLLKKNKNYYYKTNHFTAISGMIYRMRQNAMGLASICIMSTAVLVMISTSVSLYMGIEDMVSESHPYDVTIMLDYDTQGNINSTQHEADLSAYLEKNGIEHKNFNSFALFDMVAGRTGNQYGDNRTGDNFSSVMLISKADYETQTGNELPPLDAHEIALYSSRKEDSITLFGQSYTVKTHIEEADLLSTRYASLLDYVYIIMSDISEMQEVYLNQTAVYADRDSDNISDDITLHLAFNFVTPNATTADFVTNQFRDDLSNDRVFTDNTSNGYGTAIKQNTYEVFLEMFGGLLFLGVFLGFLFLMATVLIIYYKQIVEGFDDRGRFEIMQKIGMSHGEVKQSIKSQIVIVFALPLLVAVVHICVAFPILTKLLELLALSNISLFAICTAITVLVFASIYCVIYMLTSRVYYKIVNR